MPAHLIATTTPAAADGAWAALSAAFTEQVEVLTGRDDLTVTCAPGAGHGSPGCFIPALATVELDGTHLGHPPATCDPRRPSDRDRYPALWGVLVHEAAHARHSTWRAPADADPAYAEAATLLEESRIEAAHVRRRPADRRWLRAATHRLILTDYTTAPARPVPAMTPAPGGTSPTALGEATAGTAPPEVAMTPWEAARAAALLLARVDADVLDDEETTTVKTTVTEVLGDDRLAALTELWRAAHTTADDDATTMLDLGRRWCTILGADADTPAPGCEGEPGRPSPLADAIAATLSAVAEADAPPTPIRSAKADEREAEKAARALAERTARVVFDRSGAAGDTAITGTRPPTVAEQAAARRLARHLKAAAHRERITTTTTSATPPGRLRMRGALTADAQRAAGATPTAEPFTHTTRRHIPTPPLRLGIACDVSGSMTEYARPVASAAWILARAAAHVPDASSATVIFGDQVRPITYPGRTPARVREFAAADGTERFCEAIDALDAALGLSHPGAARLLVIVSDGILVANGERPGGQHRITRLTTSGCGVLWLAPTEHALVMDGAHPLTLTDPADVAVAIGHAATRALHTT